MKPTECQQCMKSSSEFEAALRGAITFDVSRETLAKLYAHWQLLRRWKDRTNLTGADSDQEAGLLHYADSLMALEHLRGSQVVDMGSGAGFPGIPLAIAAPDLQFTLVEPRRKRASLLSAAVAELGLPNVQVIEARSTDNPVDRFSTLVTRAVFSGTEDLLACKRWVQPGGRLIAWRSEPLRTDQKSDVVHYDLRDHPRVLQLWEVD